MPCDCCAEFRDNENCRQGSPSCVFCGARLIQIVQRMRRPKTETVERCRAILADWLRFGHSEAEIRALAKSPKWAVEQGKRT